jgi:uncharacterized protein (UPF0335 family)
MVCDEKYTDIQKVHTAFNKLAPTLKFTTETENDEATNFLDIAIKHKGNRLEFNVHRKPTATDVIIHKDSCHPPEQKQAAIIHMVNRMNTYKLNNENKQKEQQIIEQIAASNGFDTSAAKHINIHRKRRGEEKNNKELWAKFTYFGKETRAVTKLFKDTPIRVAYKVNNTIKKGLAPKPENPSRQQQYEKSGIYSLTCPDCNRKYVGQMDCAFRKRYKEHFHYFKYNIKKSSFATHLLENNHSMGPTEEVMDILHTTRKGKYMDTVEKFYIYKETQENNQINDKNTVKSNAMFEAMLGHYTKG